MKVARFLLGVALVATGLAACSGDGVGGYGGAPTSEVSTSSVDATTGAAMESADPTA